MPTAEESKYLQFSYLEAAFSTSFGIWGGGFGSYEPSTGTFVESVYVNIDDKHTLLEMVFQVTE